MRRALVALSVGLALLASPGRAAAYCQMTTVEGSCAGEGTPLYWGRPCLEYALDMRGSRDVGLEELEDALAASFAAWQAAECGGAPVGFRFQPSAQFADCRQASFDNEGGNANVVAFAPGLSEGPILALTTVWYSKSTGQIFDADIMVNEDVGTFGICPSEGCAQPGPPHDLANLFTHEIGHFLGLEHSEDPEATMYESSVAGEVLKRSLAADDLAGLCATYDANPLPAACDFTPRGGRALRCGPDAASSGGCGCLVARGAPTPAPWPLGALLLASLGLTALRRKVGRRPPGRG